MHFKKLSRVGSYLTTYDLVQPMECCDPEGKGSRLLVSELNGRICESLVVAILYIIKYLLIGTETDNNFN
jgi:hypothetical protein